VRIDLKMRSERKSSWQWILSNGDAN